MSDSRKCAKCGAVLNEGARFCTVCGQAVRSDSAPPNRTVMDFGSDPPRTPVPPRNPLSPAKPIPASDRVTDLGVRPPVGAAGRTALGLSDPKRPDRQDMGDVSDAIITPSPSQTAKSEPASGASDRPRGAALGSAGRTMMGMPNLEELRRATAAAQQKGTGGESGASRPEAPDAGGGGVPKGTMIGIAPGMGAALSGSGSETAAAGKGAGAESKPPQLQHTMVGFDTADLSPAARAAIENTIGESIPAPVSGPAPASDAAPSSGPAPRSGGSGRAGPSAADSGGRTMLGVGLGEALQRAEDTTEPVPRRSRPGVATEPVLPVKRKLAPVLLVLALLVLGGAVAFVALRGDAGVPGVQASVVRDGALEFMQFTVPGAPAGAKLRFGGQEKPLEAGQTRFQLAPDSLTVGKNAVLVEVVTPDGTVTSERILLELQHRVTLDTSPLRAGKSAVDVVVAAMPGSKVTLDGKPLELDLQGRAVRTDPLDIEPESNGGRIDSIEHVVEYRVQPPQGEAQVGSLRTRIPLAALQIDRPGQDVVTEAAIVEIAGAVGPDTRVTIGGRAVPVQEGRFLHQLPLPHHGKYVAEVVATAEGRAPRAAKVQIERVADLEQAAAGFRADASLTYAKLAQNPAIYRGQRAAFEGRVYNVAVQKGRSVLQMLVRECPAGMRCPLWVTYPAATEWTTDSWVRALGVVAGEQSFRAENDEIRTVPKLEATFLLPAEP